MTSITGEQPSKSRKNSVEQDEQKTAPNGNNENMFSLKHEHKQELKQSTDNSTDQPASTFRSNHDALKHGDNYSDEDEELSVESPTNTSNKRSVSASSKRDGAGSSCHQCKSAKDPSMLLFCSSPAEKGHRKRKCRKKYCESCLKRSYLPEVADPQHSNRCGAKGDIDPSTWTCPSCLNICVCAACTRLTTDAGRESLLDAINALKQLPAAILSFLGIRTERLAEVQMMLSSQPGTPTHPLGPLEIPTQNTLTQITNSLHAHDQEVSQLVNQAMMSNQFESNMSYQQAELARDMITERVQAQLLYQAVHSSMFADSMNQSHAHSVSHSASQSNTWMPVGPNTPAPRVRAEIDLTGTPLQQSMPQSLNISPLQSSSQPNHHALHITPLQHARNQSYHSVSGSANGSPSSIATTNSMHSQPISPASLSQSLPLSNDQNYALISSNPTSENHGFRRHGHSNHSVMNQSQLSYSHTGFNDHQQWSVSDSENESRRREQLAVQSISHPSNQSMNDTMNMMAVRSLNEFDQSGNPLMNQHTYTVETRKRAHSACMSDVTDDQLNNHPVSARQRVSPPGLPRSINSSSGQPRKRSADQHAYHHSAPGHTRHLSQEQLEWEMTRQMQEHSLNQSMHPTNYNFSPSLNPSSNQSIAQSVTPYDINYDANRRYSRVQPFDLDQQLVNQSMYMMDQQSIIQALNVMDQAAMEQNIPNQSINQAYAQPSYNQAVNHYDAPANHQADVMRPVMEAETMILQCRQIQHYQQQILNQAQPAPQAFNQF